MEKQSILLQLLVCSQVVFVDLQWASLSTPAVDLSLLIYTSSHPELREDCMNELVQGYHDQLRNEMALYGYDVDQVGQYHN